VGGRQVADRGLRDGGNFGVGFVDAGTGLEEDLDDGAAGEGDGLEVLDIADRGGHVALDAGGDTAFDFLRAQAGVVPDAGEDGDIDIRKNIGGCAGNHQRADKENQQREHDKGVGPGEGDSDDPHVLLST
jgi:hypothetical protein